jgi:putative glutamine amidotransferase
MPPDGTLEEKFALRHEVTVSEEGPFKKLFGKNKVLTNTLHGQGIMTPGKRVVIDGYAHDGTPEALYIANAPGFTMSVQWHPEYCASKDPVSKPLFEAFGKATHDFHRYRNY